VTHLPYVVAAYAFGVLVPGTFAVAAFMRMCAAQRRLAAIDPRVKSPGAGPRVNPGSSPGPGAGPRRTT
jgi:hypothetical protein